MFERFTRDARQAVKLAQENARRLNHHFVGNEHIVLGLLDQPESVSARVLIRHGLDHERAYRAVFDMIPPHAGDRLDADALEAIGIDLSAIRERVEAAFGPGSLDRPPQRTRQGRLVSGRHVAFTGPAKKALELSLREAISLKHNHISDGHILLGVLRAGPGPAHRILAQADVDLETLREEVVAEMA
ncbi:Clp protease N-terminal domain-containing protein [Planobispora longispora]|uniref:Clp protease n=1 Tax=Planobispora longispora TaxID=28887 RepID=A0A8J3RPL2_9ACTN|nr:Clp protease N-terminal domain-containing protein [Planobispora longispora]BFE83471.1 Clp protease N-terminal domain-containing protein [Planobispora longispora]GIH77364.1 Clp protease [Planobispora longispora]